MSCTARYVTALMLALTLGLHWTALQSVAWVTMLVNYSAENSLQTALVKTFDGNHPCRLCVVVAEGKKAEQEQQPTPLTGKIDWMLAADCLVLDLPALGVLTAAPVLPPISHAEAPPGPPPRLG